MCFGSFKKDNERVNEYFSKFRSKCFVQQLNIFKLSFLPLHNINNLRLQLTIPLFLSLFCNAGHGQTAAKSKLITVATFGHHRPIGVTVSPVSNRVFVSFPHSQPFQYALVEIKNGQAEPYPDTRWNKFVTFADKSHFSNVQDLTTDDQNNLWVLDAAPGRGPGGIGYFKLLRINLERDAVERIYYFDDLDKYKIALNDVNIDHVRGLAYLSDPGSHAIVVLNLATGKSRILLKDHPAMLATPGLRLHLDGKDVVDLHDNAFVSNVNGIALTTDKQYLYFRAINQLKLYRIKTDCLADSTLSYSQLSSCIEDMGETGICHGMIADKLGNIYLSASPDHAIKFLSPDGKLHTLIVDSRIIWPDSFGIGSDGFLYFSCSQINRSPAFNAGIDQTDYPYRVYKVALPEQ